MKKSLLPLLMVGLWLAASSSPTLAATAQQTWLTPAKDAASGIQYLSGGVDLQERASMKPMAKTYDLKLVFDTSAGDYLSNVPVKIQDKAGKTVLQQTSRGPWFLAQLSPGEYRVTAIYNGRSEGQRITVGQRHQTVILTWPTGQGVKPMAGTGHAAAAVKGKN
jgi:hypothetical protein